MGKNTLNNMNKSNPKLPEILKGLDNKWVILSENNDKIIAFADDLGSIVERLSEGILLKVPDSHSYLAPSTTVQ